MRAQTAWRAFVHGDFLDHAAEAEAQLRIARRELAAADAAAKSCASDHTALPRAELQYEIDLVDARRARGTTSSLQTVNRDLQRLRDLGLARDNPELFRNDTARFRELQAETRGTLVIPPPVVPLPATSGAPAAGGRPASCTAPDSPPYPLAPIVPAAVNAAGLRRAHGATAVTVLVGPQGNVLSTLTTASSGDPTLDQAVQTAIRLVPFAPAQFNCRPTQGEYRFTYTFPQL